MRNFFYKIPQSLRKNRLIAYGLLVLTIATCFTGMGRLSRDDSIESWLGEKSPVIQQQRELERVFGNNEDMAIIVEAKDGDIFSEQSLLALHRLHEKLQSYRSRLQTDPNTPLNHIREIVSLVNVPVNDVNGDSLYTHPFIGSSIPKSAQGRQTMRARALSDIDLLRRFVSSDGRIAAISLKTDFGRLSDSNESTEKIDEAAIESQILGLDVDSLTKDETSNSDTEDTQVSKSPPLSYKEYALFSRAVKELVAEADVASSFTIHYAGLPELIAFHVTIGSENKVIFSGLFLIMMAVLLLLFRHPSFVLWCMCIPILTVILTFGLQGWSGLPSSDLAAAMALLLIIIGVADAVHIMAEYRRHRLGGDDHTKAIAESMSKAGLSCLLTSLTTMVAFLSLYLVKPNFHTATFGLFTTLGLGIAFILTLVLLPLLLDVWRPSYKNVSVSKIKENDNVDIENARGFYAWFPARVCQHPSLTLALFFAIFSPLMVGVIFLKVDSNPLESFDESTYIRQAAAVADKYMGGTQNIDFMVNTGAVDALYDARVLHTMDKLQQRMREHFGDLIVTDTSIVNVLKRINQQFHGNDSSYYVLPDNNEKLGQLLFLFNTASPDERRKLIGDDFDAAKITFGLRNSGSSAYIDLVNTANKWGGEMFSDLKTDYPKLEVVTAGGVVIFMTLFERIADSQITCFLITLLVVTITLLFMFRSLKIGLLATIPNLVPVLVTFGVMGWLGVTMNNVTMIIAPIILGIAVDDTIHFVNRLRSLLEKGSSIDMSIRQTFLEVGKALTFTTVILSAGMLTLLYSSNAEFRAFAYLSSAALFTALAAEFMVTPALVKLFLTRTEKAPISEGKSYEVSA